MIKAARHQYLLLPQIAQAVEIKEDMEIKEDTEAKEDMEVMEVQETLATIRGGRAPRQAQILRHALIPRAGGRRRTWRAKRKGGDCGTSWNT